MTKEFAQTFGVLLMTMLCACSADPAADSANSTTLNDQAAMLGSVLRNSAAPTQEQLTALQMSDSHNAFIHSDVPFELWHFFGISSDGHNQRLAHSTRVSRLNVRGDKPDASASSWAFNDVMVLESDIVDIATAQRQARQQVERVALGLAGVDTDSNKVWVGSTSIRKSIERLSGSAESKQLTQKDKTCIARYRLDLPISNSSTRKVNAAQVNCRNSSILRSAVRTSARSMKTTLSGDATDKNIQGRAWLVQGWGWPINNDDAAVVFDRAWLIVDDKYEIQLQQTKRRSGKGPKTATGTLWSISSGASKQPVEDLTVQWITNRTGSAIQWHITSESPRIDIVAEQVVETALSPEGRWFGPVTISGSHQGMGFMDYRPI